MRRHHPAARKAAFFSGRTSHFTRKNVTFVLAGFALIAGGVVGPKLQSSPAAAQEAAVPDCTYGLDQFSALARKAWHPSRYKEWTAKPPHKQEIEQMHNFFGCAQRYDVSTANQMRDIWNKQKDEFAKAWEDMITPPGKGWLASTRSCEAGTSGLYRANTGNGFYGAYQFDGSSWASAGGKGIASNAPPREQDYRAAVWFRLAGAGAWPNCG